MVEHFIKKWAKKFLKIGKKGLNTFWVGEHDTGVDFSVLIHFSMVSGGLYPLGPHLLTWGYFVRRSFVNTLLKYCYAIPSTILFIIST